ncbi:neuropeptide FF receptor 2-like [Argonauta hians]
MAVVMTDMIAAWSTVNSISTRAAEQNLTPVNDVTSVTGLMYTSSESMTDNFTGSIGLENIPYPRELKVFPMWEIIVKTLFYVIVMVAATAGNCLVIAVVYTNARMQTTTNFYIVNLAASDLLVTLSCSWVHLVFSLNEDWVLGAFFCKFNSFAQVTSTVSSILTLTFIACDRFFGILFAFKAHIAERRAWYAIVTLWLISIVVAAPLLYVRRLFVEKWANHTERFCIDDWTLVASNANAIKARRIYYTFVSIVLFFIPVLLMTLAYAMIIWKLWSAQIPGERLETEKRNQLRIKRKIIVMLMMILAAFVICWLPYQIIILYSEYKPSGIHAPLGPWFDNLNYISLFIAYANSAINPFIYAGFNDNFKKGVKTLFHCRRKRSLYMGMESSRTESFHSSTMVTKV